MCLGRNHPNVQVPQGIGYVADPPVKVERQALRAGRLATRRPSMPCNEVERPPLRSDPADQPNSNRRAIELPMELSSLIRHSAVHDARIAELVQQQNSSFTFRLARRRSQNPEVNG